MRAHTTAAWPHALAHTRCAPCALTQLLRGDSPKETHWGRRFTSLEMCVMSHARASPFFSVARHAPPNLSQPVVWQGVLHHHKSSSLHRISWFFGHCRHKHVNLWRYHNRGTTSVVQKCANATAPTPHLQHGKPLSALKPGWSQPSPASSTLDWRRRDEALQCGWLKRVRGKSSVLCTERGAPLPCSLLQRPLSATTAAAAAPGAVPVALELQRLHQECHKGLGHG